MLRTYEGILDGNRVQWAGDDVPEADRPVRVHITVLEDEAGKKKRGKQMADALAKLADVGAFSEIDSPVEWQREIRNDRPLPGRDG